MPMAAVELKHHVCCTQKPSTGYPATNSFPTMATHFVMDMHTPPTSPLNIKRFFKHRFRNMDLLSSAHHLGFPSRTNLCVPPQPACFGESCLTLGTRIMFCYSVKICDQERPMFIWGTPILSKHKGRYFKGKVLSLSTSYPAIPC